MKYKIEHDLDDPRATIQHREIILAKPFLKKIYEKWYNSFIDIIPALPEGMILEVGSGGGFLKERIPSVITSDILQLPHVELNIDAQQLPFESKTLAAIFMINVFHHIPNPELFLLEAQRTLKQGGKIVMIEPANTLFGSWIYRNFHHEPFDPNGGWTIEAGRPMSTSNQALPYIYFQRDTELFQLKFANLKIDSINYHTPFSYLISGGVSRRPLLPNWSYSTISLFEKIVKPLNRFIGLFVTIQIIHK